MYQSQHHRDFDQRANDSGKSFSGIDAKYRDSNSYRKFEIVACGSKGQSSRFLFTRSELAAHPVRQKKHNDKVDRQRNGYSDNIPGNRNDQVPFQAEHDHNRK